MEFKVSSAGIKIGIVRTIEGLSSLQNDWVRLSGQVEENSFYIQPDFLSIWWKHFGQEPDRPFLLKRGINIAGNSCGIESLFVLVARIDDKVVAILPLMLLTVRPYGENKLLKCLSFLGDYIFNPAPCIICLEERKEDIFNSFAAFLKESPEWDVIFLNSIRQDFKNLQYFLTILEGAFKGRVIHSPLLQVQFIKHWNRNNVIKYLKILSQDKDDAGLNNDVCQLLDEIEHADNAEFAQKCLSDITPRLKSVLDRYKGNFKDTVIILNNEISPTLPYIYQILPLPSNLEEYRSTISSKEKRRIHKEEREFVNQGISLEFQNSILEKDFDLFVSLHKQRYPNSVHFNDFTMTYYKNLLDKLTGCNYLFWLIAKEANQNIVFFGLCFYSPYIDSVEWVLRGGERRNLGDLYTVMLIEKSIELKCRHFSFRMGNERYKERFHPQVIPLECFILSRNLVDNPINILPKQFTIA
jgi:hypothetical protein